MKTNKQIEVIVFRRAQPTTTLFLMLKRNEQKGGFWQPITGGLEEGEEIEVAARRELEEETGIRSILRLIDTGYTFKFFDNGQWHTEFVFGAEVGVDAVVRLSAEHTEALWVTENDATVKYLKYPGNRAGLKALVIAAGL
jgi:8-oxo-dGTP pyrophosphatase MutT (NUDIX family)